MLTLLGADFGPNGAVRSYQHPQLGVLHILTMYGRDGSADIVKLHGALLQARTKLRVRAGEDLWSAIREVERQTPSRARHERRRLHP
jgi:hypothetical protein